MEKHIRFGLLATLAVHILPAGIWFAQSPRFPVSSPASSGDRTVEVQLRTGGNTAMSDSQQAAADSQSLPVVSPTAVSGERSIVPSEEPTHPFRPESIQPTAGLPGTAIEELPYLPAGELDVRPQPETPIIIPFPDRPASKQKMTGILVLYVGTDGHVDRVEVDQSDLPPDFEKAAIDTFLQARMQPGIKHGRASRARMKVLVEFEAL